MRGVCFLLATDRAMWSYPYVRRAVATSKGEPHAHIMQITKRRVIVAVLDHPAILICPAVLRRTT